MALVSAAQAAKIKATYPQFADVAAKAEVGELKTETVMVLASTVRKYRKVILPNKQVVSIDES